MLMNKLIKWLIEHKIFFAGFPLGWLIIDVTFGVYSLKGLIPIVFLIIFIVLYFLEVRK